MAEMVHASTREPAGLLDIRDLRVAFDGGESRLVAVHDVELTLRPGRRWASSANRARARP